MNYTSLLWAVWNNSIGMTEVLVSKGADINAKDVFSLKIILLF